MNKKGDTSIMVGALIALIVSIGFILILSNLQILNFLKPKKECDNINYFQELKTNLEKLDSKIITKSSTNFYNNPCKLVTFFIGKSGDIAYPVGLDITTPTLCLCKLEKNACKVKNRLDQCYRFKNIKGFTGKQFTTKEYRPDIFLEFTVENDQLSIKEYGTKSEPVGRYITNIKTPETEYQVKSASIFSSEKLTNENTELIIEPSEDTVTFGVTSLTEKRRKYRIKILRNEQPFTEVEKIILYGTLSDEYKEGRPIAAIKETELKYEQKPLEWKIITKENIDPNMKELFPEGYYSVELETIPHFLVVSNIR